MKKIFFLLLLAGCATYSTKDSLESREPSSFGGEVNCASTTRRVVADRFHPADVQHIRVAFFDADSTLRVTHSGAVTPSTANDVRLLPGVGRHLKALADQGYLLYIVSNQGGVQAGRNTCEVAEGGLQYTIQLISSDGGFMDGYDFAENNNSFRKPNVGMANTLEQSLKRKFGSAARIDKGNSLMVGDSAYQRGVDTRPDGTPGTHFSNADRLFAQNYGVHFIEAAVFFEWRQYGIDVFENEPQVNAFVATHH